MRQALNCINPRRSKGLQHPASPAAHEQVIKHTFQLHLHFTYLHILKAAA